MKVDVSWGPKNSNVSYHVSGADLGAALEFLKTRSEWGEFVGDCPAKWRANGRDVVTGVWLEPTSFIRMPSWPAYKTQPQECKNTWDAMYVALRKHEEGHGDLFDQLIKEVAAQIEALETATVAEIKEILASSKTEMQERSDKYDNVTEHGAARGVTLNITEACRSKAKTR
jgi:predicted secreted Zn-dependent protease